MTMRVRVSFMLTVAVAMLALTSCDHYDCTSGATFGSSACSTPITGTGGGGTLNNGVSALVYLTLDDQVEVEALNLAGSGTYQALASLQTPLYTANPTGLVIVLKQFLYVSLSNNTLYGYSIDGITGALTAVPNSPYSIDSAYSLTADPAGRFLFVAGISGISVFTVNATDGSLTLNTSSPFSPGTLIPTQMATDGQGKYLYALQQSSGSEIAEFSYDQTSGTLTPVVGSPFASTMAELVGESSGRYMLGITNQQGSPVGSVDDHLYVFAIAQTGTSAGALSAAGTPVSTANSPIDLTVSPNGSFVYTFDRDSGGTIVQMEGFQLNGSGVLTELTASLFSGLTLSTGRFEQSGAFLLGELSLPVGEPGGGMQPFNADSSSGAITKGTYPAYGGSVIYGVTDAP